jgi:alkylation response protein AidB-like acyl-CoA dehydrogenase
VNVDPTSEQELFRENLRTYLEEEIAPEVDELDKEPLDKGTALDLLEDLDDLGLGFDPKTADAYFGDLRYYGIGSEEISAVWPSLNVLLNMSFPAMWVQFASAETQDAYMDLLQQGRCIGCLAVSEPGGGSDTTDARTTATPEGGGYRLTGEKTWVSNATIADVALVVAHDEESGGRDMFLVDGENTGWETSELDKIGWKGSPTGTLVLDDAWVPRGNRMTEMITNTLAEGHALHEVLPFPEPVVELFLERKPLNVIFSFMRTGMALMAVGIMRACFEQALEYARQRETFGEPIGSKQLIQEKLYEMKADLESSRHLAYHAIDLLEEGDPESRMMASLAKGKACSRSEEVASEAIQILGAQGLSTEYPLERFYRDARTMTIPDGTTEIQKLIVGKELTGLRAY